AAAGSGSASMADERPSPDQLALQTSRLVGGAGISLRIEQRMLADLFGMPTTSDITLICTSVRGTTGKRPVWADHTDSIFYFPWTQIRFLEVPPDFAARARAQGSASAAAAARGEADVDEELDEEFLRKVREA